MHCSFVVEFDLDLSYTRVQLAHGQDKSAVAQRFMFVDGYAD